MQLTRTTQSPPDHNRTIKTIRHRRRRGHSHVRTRSGSLSHQHQERRRRSYTRSSSSSSSSSSGDEHHHKRKEIGATLVGAAGGGALAKEVLGGGTLATLGGVVAGAVAANALEKRHERYLYHLFPQFSIILLILLIYPHTWMMWSPPSHSPQKKKVLTRGTQNTLVIKTSAEVVFPIETILTTTADIIIIIIIAALLIHARSKMRLKINSPIFSPRELMIPGRGAVAKAEDDPGGVVVEDKGGIYRGGWRLRVIF